MRRGFSAAAAVAVAVALTGTACSSSDSGSKTPASASSAATTASSAAATASPTTTAAPVAADKLPALVPIPANSQTTKGPDNIADGGIHLYFQVNGSPTDVMTAYKAALEEKGWTVTTMVTSGGQGGGGATYTGTNGGAYGVFDGGGYSTNTYLDVCAWPTKPASPNCSRGAR
ncbi:hypothetical protein Y900_005360 [Mycolicibacterium aromaticivorans JS19b1 = JCM 16368]|uniref:Lipoprotein n=1 Tax=Mycolicibacterium aromaticivorans JS19b1 = JCM 16368 TaxID=1440774 RepID=A0A064CCP4_9MYCO|nr:hypothetical protein [Mycolicibacterium aromaticivorans]KDE98379.1 hypothetical protein Y900_005360 [Mycolicibacterium aromaticivorans JS19b1 = JCM 16368]